MSVDVSYYILNTSDTTQRMRLGERLVLSDDTYGHRTFRYVKFAALTAAGQVNIPVTANWNCTNVIPNASDAISPLVIAIAANAAASFGVGQTGGLHTAVALTAATDTSAAVGKAIVSKTNSTGLAAICSATPTATEAAAKIGVCTVNGGASVAAIAVALTGLPS